MLIKKLLYDIQHILSSNKRNLEEEEKKKALVPFD